MKLRNDFGKRVKIDSLKYRDIMALQSRIEEALSNGGVPVVQHFNRDQHLEATVEIAMRHRLTIILNPKQTECGFRRHF